MMSDEGAHDSSPAARVTVPGRMGRPLWIGGGVLLILAIRLWTGGSGAADTGRTAAFIRTAPTLRAAPTIDDHARYHDRSFRVVRVVDGDTLDLAVPDGDRAVTRVRLWGVDTPEIAHGGAPAAYFGDEAARFAADMLAGRVVHVVLAPNDTRGKYGRLLAYIQLDRGGEMFNEMLLRKGFAYADPRFDHPYRRAFLDIEKRARRSRRGLWADVAAAQMPSWRQRRASRTD